MVTMATSWRAITVSIFGKDEENFCFMKLMVSFAIWGRASLLKFWKIQKLCKTAQTVSEVSLKCLRKNRKSKELRFPSTAVAAIWSTSVYLIITLVYFINQLIIIYFFKNKFKIHKGTPYTWMLKKLSVLLF